ncbi:MAG: HAMP domain-containing histidine kinase [Peptococcaceae bacterium]|nr:HAMP domain-containing histidine kinase [Peptococcaceae bacterium]
MQRNKIKLKTLLQNASHELKTSLMSIQSYAEGIKHNVVDSITAVNIIIDETRRMTCLVEDLLCLSRLDKIDEHYHFSNVSINELINNCIKRVSGIALRSNKRIITSILNEDIEINADEERLSRAIINIISNCIRYASNVIRIVVRSTENNKVEIIISDDGPGFDENDLPYIFERFYKGKKGNSGIGLAVSKSIIEKHNGKIIAGNTASGAMIIIELPLIQPHFHY